MHVKKGWVMGVAAGLLALTAVGPAHAGATGRRNTAAALGAAAAFEALRGEGTGALVLGAGALGAYSRYRDARDRDRYDDYYYRHRRNRDRDDWRDDRYDRRSRSRVRYHRERDRYDDYDRYGDRYDRDRYDRDRDRHHRERDRDYYLYRR